MKRICKCQFVIFLSLMSRVVPTRAIRIQVRLFVCLVPLDFIPTAVTLNLSVFRLDARIHDRPKHMTDVNLN